MAQRTSSLAVARGFTQDRANRRVTRIADALQPGTRTLLTEVDIPNPDGALSPGMYCTIELQIPRKTPSLLVPADALIFNSGGLQVAVVENGVAHIRKILLSRDLGTEIEVRDGVNRATNFVLNPPINLIDGSRVVARSDNKADVKKRRPRPDAALSRQTRRPNSAMAASGMVKPSSAAIMRSGPSSA